MTTFRHTFVNIKQLPNTFWVVIFATGINQLGTMALVLLIPYLTIYLKISLPLASMAMAICTFAILLSGLIGGPLADRFGPARIMTLALLTNSLILLSFPWCHHFILIAVMCFFWGFTLGVYRPASQTLLAYLSPSGTYKITYSIFRLAINLGMSVGPAVGGYLAMHSFPAIFMVNGIANLIGGIILMYGLSNKFSNPSSSPSFDLGFRWLKQDMILRLFVIGMIPIAMVFFQHSSTLSVFLHQDLHFSLGFYGLMFSLNTLMIVFLELPLNIAMMSWSTRRSLMTGTFLLSLGFAGYMLVSNHWQASLCTIIWTFGEMILMPSASAFIAEIAPANHRGSYMSIFTTSTNLGLFLGPWIGGLIMHFFTASGLWIACGLWGVCSMVLFSFVKNQKQSFNPIPER